MWEVPTSRTTCLVIAICIRCVILRRCGDAHAWKTGFEQRWQHCVDWVGIQDIDFVASCIVRLLPLSSLLSLFLISTYISSSASHSLVSISLSVPFQSDRLPFRDRLERSEWSEFRQGRRKGGNKWIEGKSERTLMPQKYLTIVVAYISPCL